jgi:geranylgeranyl diphosphate synthase, type II
LLTDAFTLLAHTRDDSAELRGRLVYELALASGAVGMVGGQVLDIAQDRPAELAYLKTLHAKKTGALIRAACRLGVLAVGGNAAQLEAASEFGACVGLAFQVADDILDVTQSAEVLGKPTGADAASGRHTFPVVVGLEASRNMARDMVAKAKEAIRCLEPEAGVLSALADFSIQRLK